MASINPKDCTLSISPAFIFINDFYVPFGSAQHLIIKKNNVVQVCFYGAMGIEDEVLIEFWLDSAAQVNRFVQELLNKTSVKIAATPNSPIQPLYFISPTSMSKPESQESFEEFEGMDWDQVYTTVQNMTDLHPRLLPVAEFFLRQYRLINRNDYWDYPYRVEILKNAYRDLIKFELIPKLAQESAFWRD